MSSSDHQEVADVLDRYADGLYSANPAVLRTVFHDHLNYVNASPCSFTTQGLRDYMNVVGRRVSPDRLGDARNARVVQTLARGRAHHSRPFTHEHDGSRLRRCAHAH